MPRYRYNGDKKLVSTEYNLFVEPNEEFTTKWILPDNFNCELLDITDVDAITPRTTDITLNAGETIAVNVPSGYIKYSIYLLSGSGKVYIKPVNNDTSDDRSYTIDDTNIVSVNVSYYNLSNIFLKADDSNTEAVTIRIAFETAEA